MKQAWIYPFALLSLANAVVDSDKIFTQDTTLDSSCSSISSAPASGEELEWGEIRGGSKDSPITLSTTQALNISSISNPSGGVIGLSLSFRSYAKLNGDITFSSLSGSDEVVGIFGKGLDGIINVGNLDFKQISSSKSYAIGFIGTTLTQQGVLSFENIEAKGGDSVGAIFYTLSNEANSTITLSGVSQRSARGFFGHIFSNSGNIQIKSLSGEMGAVGIEAGVQNSGNISIDSLSSQGRAVAFLGNVKNFGGIKVDSMSALGDSVGITGLIENQKDIVFTEILSNTRSVGMIWDGDISNDGNISFGKIGGSDVALGIFNSQIINNGVISLDSIVSNKLAIGLSGGIDGSGKLVFQEISAPRAVGIYGGGWFQGEGSVVFENISGAQSCGILLENGAEFFSFLPFYTLSFHFKSIQSGVGIDNPSGFFNMQGSGVSFVFGQTMPTQTDSTIFSDIKQAKYYLNEANIDSPYQYAFYANQEADVYIGDSKKARFYAKNYSFGGESNLHLGVNAEARLGTGGSLKALHSNKAVLDLDNGGHSQRLLINNFQAQDSQFILSVDLERSQFVGYNGGAVYENNVVIKKGIGSFLQIDSLSTTSQLNNTLAIDLESKKNTTQKYILLASVSGANRDNITFNSLSNGQTITITPTSGYEAEGLEIGRYDDEKTQTNYFYLVANPYEASTTTPSTPTIPSVPNQDTPSQSLPQEVKEEGNSLIYNPNQSYLLSTFDWGKTRFAKLRDETRSGRIWADLGAEYWQYSGTQASEEGFIDFMVGGDYIFSFAKGRNALGVAVEVTGEFITQNQVLNNQPNKLEFGSTFLSVALYNVLMLDSGVYSHTVFRVGGGGGEFDGDSVMIGAEDFSQEATIYSFSQKVGKRFFLSSQNTGFFTDLSALVAVGYAESSLIMQEDSWYAPWGSAEFLSISSKASFVNQNKIEALIGYKSSTNSFFSFDMSAGVGLVSNHCIGGEMRYQSKDYNVEFANTPYVGGLEASVNLVARMGNWVDAFVSVSSTWSKQYNEVIDFSAGIKLRFGSI